MMSLVKLVATSAERVAHRVMVVYGGEAEKWGGTLAHKSKRWATVMRPEYDIRVRQVCEEFRRCGLNTTNGAEDLRDIVTGHSDPSIKDCTDSWHFSISALLDITNLVEKWILAARSPTRVVTQPPTHTPKPAAAAEPPALPTRAAAAEPPAAAAAEPPAAELDGDLVHFLRMAGDAARRFFPACRSTPGTPANIMQQALDFIADIQRHGLPEQLDLFEEERIKRVAHFP